MKLWHCLDLDEGSIKQLTRHIVTGRAKVIGHISQYLRKRANTYGAVIGHRDCMKALARGLNSNVAAALPDEHITIVLIQNLG